jgi:hypothetical protein
MEAYRNKFLATTTAHYAANWRTGPDIMFDNVYASGTPAYSANSIDATLYRTNGTTSYLAGLCTGVNPIDGNLGSGAIPTGNIGWPCVDQTGWYFPAAAPTTWNNGTHAQYWPAYIWENSIGGVNAGITLNDNAVPCTGTCTFTSTYVVSDRDYYAGGIVAQTSSSSPFDGTTGVGFGTLARRPATCTTNTATNALAATLGGGTGGVAYWAIDQGSWNGSVTDGAFNPRGVNGESGILYKCTATNTWTAYYTPYTYPHPLQGSAPAIPAAPTGLRTLGTSTGTTCTVTWNESGLANLVGYHLSYGTSTGAYTNTITKTVTLSTAAHQPPRQHTFRFPVAGTYYITVTGFSASVSDTAAATEVTCTSTGLSRTQTGTGILATDAFTGTGATLGSNWSDNAASNVMERVSDIATATATNNDSAARYSAITWPADHYSKVTHAKVLTSGGLGAGYGPCIGMSTSGTTATYYSFVGSTAGWELSKRVNNSFTSLDSGASPAFADGDIATIQRVGNTITAIRNGAVVSSKTDSTIQGGAAGICFSSSGGNTTFGITSWEGGTSAAGRTGAE